MSKSDRATSSNRSAGPTSNSLVRMGICHLASGLVSGAAAGLVVGNRINGLSDEVGFFLWAGSLAGLVGGALAFWVCERLFADAGRIVVRLVASVAFGSLSAGSILLVIVWLLTLYLRMILRQMHP
jgi:hypothetical protein